jgi:hypothetical protein
MKKLLGIFLLLAMLTSLVAGCGNGGSGGNAGNAGNAAATSDRPEVDVDLTVLSSTMAQAEFFNILSNAADYMGKTIRVSGPYYSMYWAETGRVYHFVMVVEGDECCRMGMEFVRSGDYVYPDDYPSQYTMVEIVGVLGTYEEQGQSWVYLQVDEIIIL